MKKITYLIFSILSVVLISCSSETGQTTTGETDNTAVQQEVQAYLDSYNTQYQNLLRDAAEAEWKLNTMIIEGDTMNAYAATQANEKFAAFTGSKENIEKATLYLDQKENLSDMQVKQLEAIMYFAGANPATAEQVVKAKIKADAEQTEKLFGYNFTIDGKPVSTNKIDEMLRTSTNTNERLKAWRASKDVGKELKSGLEKLVDLRNQSVQALGYDDYFDYQVSEYGMTSEEMLELNKQFIKDVWPLYRELHTWARYELAKKYNQPVPDLIPAHWLPNRWGQDWSALVEVEGINLDKELQKKTPEWIVQQGEQFYVSLGFPALPASFYTKSSLYPLHDTVSYKKNNHASAWHMDNENDVRSLMSVEPNADWWETTLHELGHIYYYISYTNDDVPIILRGGANRAYHEAIGSMIGLAAMQKPFLAGRGLLPAGATASDNIKEMQSLMKEALNYVVFIPWSSGVMTEFEYDLYANDLSKDLYNKRWWELAKKYQGMVPPMSRGEEFCDGCTKTHVNNDPAQYYDYAMSFVLLFQFHDYIAKNILNQDPHATNYWGNKEVGDFLKELTYPGASVDWREHTKKMIGADMSAKPMLDYFMPLMPYLKELNKGRTYTLPETIN